jgi:hypothetical protein
MVPGTRLYDTVMRSLAGKGPAYGQRLVEFRLATKQVMGQHGFKPVATEAYVRGERNNFMKSTFGGGGNALCTSLAFGPSAFGFINGTLHRDTPDLAQYVDTIDRGFLPFQCIETLDIDRALRRALLMGIQRLTIPRLVVEQRTSSRRLIDRWLKRGLVTERPESYDVTDWGAVWFNQMQLEALPLVERIQMASMLGTASDQLRALAQPDGTKDGLTREFERAVRANSVTGGARLAGYKAFLQLKRLPLFADVAYNFAGRVVGPHGDPVGS